MTEIVGLIECRENVCTFITRGGDLVNVPRIVGQALHEAIREDGVAFLEEESEQA